MPPKKAAPVKKAAAKPAATKATATKAAAVKKTTTAKADQPAAAAAAAPAPAAPTPKPMGETLGLKAFNVAVFQTEDGALQKSGRNPCLVDEAGRVGTFLRHRDANNLSAMNQSEMEPERIRLALIGALRFGKPLVIDLVLPDTKVSWDKVVEGFNKLEPGLLDKILDLSIIKEENFKQLVKESDGDLYKIYNFSDQMLAAFKFIVLSPTPDLPKEVIEKFYVITIE